ncbi:MAG: TIGR01459 family HAD-type hydrolase [Alphaproteobacteria bacterium]
MIADKPETPAPSDDAPAGDAQAGAIPIVEGLEAMAGRYQGFIVDLWGTVHDGLTPLPGAIECLEGLRAGGRPVLILSNAPRRAGPIIERMRALGIPDESYDAVFSSGEAAYLALRDRADPFHAGLDRKCFLLGPPEDDSTIAGLDYEIVESIRAAHFILAIGSFQRTDTVEDYEALLGAAHDRHLPMVCANPDLEVIRGGAREICAGAIAQQYAKSGGAVHFHGKPHKPIYQASLALLGLDAGASILAIGDSFGTDIAGANAAGLDSLMITSGIHAHKLGVEPFDLPEPERLAALAAEYGARPTAAAAAFRW